jgi:hypothetical protein
MAETQEATDGYNGEFWFGNPTTLYELRQVKSMGQPSMERERTETTHLKSPGRRRQYISTWYADSEIEVVMNGRALSDTDKLLRGAVAVGDIRPFKQVIPELGVPVAMVEGTARCTSYDPGEIGDDAIEATATFLIETVGEIEEYA